MFGLSLSTLFWIFLINGIICGAFCANLAGKKGYSWEIWSWAGFFFGIIALIAIAGSPSKWEEFSKLKECPDCKGMIKIDASVCKYCGCKFPKVDVVI